MAPVVPLPGAPGPPAGAPRAADAPNKDVPRADAARTDGVPRADATRTDGAPRADAAQTKDAPRADAARTGGATPERPSGEKIGSLTSFWAVGFLVSWTPDIAFNLAASR